MHTHMERGGFYGAALSGQFFCVRAWCILSNMNIRCVPSSDRFQLTSCIVSNKLIQNSVPPYPIQYELRLNFGVFFLYSYWPRIHFEMRRGIKIKITFVCNKMSQCHFAGDWNVKRIQIQIFMHFPRPISHRGYIAWLQSTKSLKSFHSQQLLNSALKDIKSSFSMLR